MSMDVTRSFTAASKVPGRAPGVDGMTDHEALEAAREANAVTWTTTLAVFGAIATISVLVLAVLGLIAVGAGWWPVSSLLDGAR